MRKKQSKWYFRRLRDTDKTSSYLTAFRIAYFQLLNKRPFVVLNSQRLVEIVTMDRQECHRLTMFVNAESGGDNQKDGES